MSNQLAPESPPPAIKRAGLSKGVLSPSSHAPIDEIPFELLLNIFDDYLKPIETSKYYKHLYNLMLVCSGWANLIKETPKLWSFIGESHPDRLPLVLQRSDPAPLKIERHYMGRRPDLDDALFKESYRWETIRIVQSSLDGEGDLQGRLESSVAPLLKSLCVTGKEDFSLSKPVNNLFGGQAPRLQSLCLTRFPVLLDSPICNTLRSLMLEEIDLRYLTWPSLVDTLNRFESLAIIEFDKVTFHEFPQNNAQLIIVLPSLTSFRIENLRKADAGSLLRTFHMPRCRRIAIVGFEAKIEALPARATLPHLVDTFKLALSRADRLTMSISESEYRITASRAGRNVFDFAGTVEEETLPVLEVATTEWGLAELHIPIQIRLHFEDFNLDPLLQTLRTLPSVETIVLFQVEEETVQEVLKVLSNPIEDPKGFLRWPCPKLESLLCYQCGTSGSTPSDHMTMLECRHERYKQQPGLKMPKRLRYLYIATCESDCFYSVEELRELWDALEPEGKLRWNPRVAEPNFRLQDDDGEPRGDDVPDHTTFDQEYDWLKEMNDEDRSDDEADGED